MNGEHLALIVERDGSSAETSDWGFDTTLELHVNC